jgi:hypothetical protein
MGQIYKYTTTDGKTIIDYKVISISDEGVTIEHDGKRKLIRQKSGGLEEFTEKEAPHEKPKR